ncbi:CDP-glycerol glycerophosphotransferase family protein [Thermococcus stetteri]|uniref:CDP-glycerol glycerophosphotransferase family protein n=1 Tax=Thermococcus stetteri TaxID=49900 RepID=UPI001FD84634|nr:CDP-glycerol glycerophosphotransferase family protein [Thermococcus stetteri]MBP1911702.1 CDP-glycerol glycerophosphotransferase (TagB/SpsB family) [Thermococcus stetteri]
MNRVTKQLIASRLLSLANILPKDESRIVFYSTPDVSDNALVLFKYISDRTNEYELVWLLHNPNSPVRNILKEKYPEVKILPLYSLSGLKELLQAEFVITTDVLPITPHMGQRVIQLWHGLPGKKTGYEHPLGVRDLYLYMDRWTTDFVTTSELVVGAFVRQFMINPRKFRILGQPRNDALFDHLKDAKEVLSSILGWDVETYDHVVLYAPTYRYTSYLKDFQASVNVVESLFQKSFLDFLRRENVLLVIKPHKLVAEAVKSKIKGNSNVALLTDEPLQSHLFNINDIMGAFDIMITDYSSIFEDYILLERPIVFYLPDREALEQKSGFLLPYEFFAPGKKPETVENLKKALIEYMNDPQMDAEWRETVKNLLYEVGQDNKSSERVYKHLIKGVYG